ncbi:MAG: hypothetical protein A2173_00400 [Planctomycetes bacterium RBG_13_44_8b]|nr:MAG: hypothetical protein A2173_00400 [Planctomycetes bacterium RBG_13_44_8b]
MKNLMEQIIVFWMLLFLLLPVEGCKGKTEEEEIEELVEKMGEAKTEEEAAKIADKIEKLEQKAKKSDKEVNIKLGQPFTFWNQVDTPSDDMTQFSMTFQKVAMTEENILGQRETGNKYVMILGQVKNLGPRKSYQPPSGDDIQVKTEKGYLYRTNGYPVYDFFLSSPPFPLDWKTLDKWQFPFGVLGKSVDIFKESLEPEEIGWIIYWTSIPENNIPVEVLAQFPTEPGPHGGKKRTNFRLKLTQEKKETPKTGEISKNDDLKYLLQFPLKGDWKPIMGFNIWSSNWCGRHLGEDIEREPETPVFPMSKGVVKYAKYQPEIGIGYGVIIEHYFDGQYFCSVYYHMRQPKAKETLKAEQTVTPDKPIGYISAESKDHLSLPHLHFGIRKDKYLTGRDPRTNKWYYPGYTAIYNKEGIRESNPEDPIHGEIGKEWYKPSRFIYSYTSSELSQFKHGEMMWVKCNNPNCKAEYEMDKKDYFTDVAQKVRTNPLSYQTPALVCEKCGKESIFRAIKCEKCGKVFIEGASADFSDRCPDCGFSKIEDERKQRARRSLNSASSITSEPVTKEGEATTLVPDNTTPPTTE